MNNRRKLLLAFGAGMVSMVGRAQTTRTYRVGLLFGGQKEGNTAFHDSFRKQMAVLGYAEGRNLIIDTRYGDNKEDRAKLLAEELAALHPDVLVAAQGQAVVAACRLPPVIPVVIISSGNPVDAGFVASFARPGGNVTGISLLAVELVGKRIELLKEMQPKLKTVAVIADPQHAGQHRERAASEEAAQKLAIRVLYYPARNKAELDAALIAAKAAEAEGIVVFPDGVTSPSRGAIAEFSVRNRLPVVAGWASFVEAGCLISYGPNQQASYARAAYFVDRIIKGKNPADLPVELPSVVELAVNRKTAKALDIKIPNSILVRADRVIE
jgi:putative ABC transport system substrate-binding protein